MSSLTGLAFMPTPSSSCLFVLHVIPSPWRLSCRKLQEVANSCQLLVPSIITELMKLLKDANFTTLEDLCNAMQRLNFVSKDELDGHLRQMTHKHTQQMQILVTSCVRTSIFLKGLPNAGGGVRS